MRAAAAVVAGNGRCARLRSEPPLTLRQTPDALYLVGSAAGPVGGDELRLDVEVADRATLRVRSVAAQLVFPGARNAPSCMTIDVTLGTEALLDWRPEPMVLVRGADHRSSTRVLLDRGASLVWREIVVLGRHDEVSGSVRLRMRAEREGVPLLCSDLGLGPVWPPSAGPAGVGCSRVVGTLLVAGPPAGRLSDVELPCGGDGVRAGAFALADDVLLVTALSDTVEPVATLLDQWCPTSFSTQ